MVSKGVKVKALDTLPETCEAEDFFIEVYTMCGNSITDIISYCKLLGLSREDITDTIKVIKQCQ